MTGRGIVCIAYTEWSGPWQRYHEMMRRLAGAGNTVLVVDNLYRVAPPLPRSGSGALRLLRKVWQVASTMRLRHRDVGPHLAVLTPPALPGRLGALAWPVLRRAIDGSAASLGISRPILWCGYPTPHLDRLIGALDPSLIVYDCTSALADEPATPPEVLRSEERLLRIADVVLTPSRRLWDRHRAGRARCYLVPNGVDVARFSAGVPAPHRWEGTVVGYVGTIHAWLDTDLVVEVARARPQWRFVFAGPHRERGALERIAALPNAELLGMQPHAALPSLLAQFSVTWIPYRLAPFTESVFPTKMLEYLAAGKPVVSTDLPEVRTFAPPVRIATGGAETVAALEDAMAGHDPDRARSLAARYDWAVLMRAVHDHLDAALAGS